ncbi:MAG TPA: hypothetical protein VH120_08235, partial [Gemmataceae bacterium]|nr:hypothetical protein [Gemmataceae bacterium]
AETNAKPARSVLDLKTPSQVTYSPDGRRLATGAWDGSIVLWDVATGKQVHEFAGHRARVLSLAFSPDGKRLASGSEDTTVLMWDVSDLGTTEK